MDTVRLWIFGFSAASILFFLLHIWIASGIAALKELWPKWKNLSEPVLSPTLQNLMQKPKLLKRMGTAQQILFHALFPCLFRQCHCTTYIAVHSRRNTHRRSCGYFTGNYRSLLRVRLYSQCGTAIACLQRARKAAGKKSKAVFFCALLSSTHTGGHCGADSSFLRKRCGL